MLFLYSVTGLMNDGMLLVVTCDQRLSVSNDRAYFVWSQNDLSHQFIAMGRCNHLIKN